MKVLNIYTDASEIQQYGGVRAVAWYLVCDAGNTLSSKVCPKEITDILLAEMYGMAQALYTANRIYGLSAFDKIILHSDSIHAMLHLKRMPHKPHHNVHRRLHSAFHKVRGQWNVCFNYVAAHTGQSTVESKANELVDNTCRQLARQEFNKRRTAANKKKQKK